MEWNVVECYRLKIEMKNNIHTLSPYLVLSLYHYPPSSVKISPLILKSLSFWHLLRIERGWGLSLEVSDECRVSVSGVKSLVEGVFGVGRGDGSGEQGNFIIAVATDFSFRELVCRGAGGRRVNGGEGTGEDRIGIEVVESDGEVTHEGSMGSSGCSE